MNIISNKIDELKEDLLSDIIDIVKIPSVKGESENGFPFGEKVGEALNKALEISEKLGFKVRNLDNYIGYAEHGDSDDYVCVIGHVDVVHEGDGWKHQPYKGEETNGRIYGRGVLDNKGPIMSALYGLYAIKELNLKLDKSVRIIFGTNEESGFEDIPYYLEKEKAPIMGFTPDCKYPVVYGERGRAIIKICGKKDRLKEFFDLVNNYILNAKNNGERFNIDFQDQEFGLLEVRNYQLELDGDPSIQFSVSYPASVTVETIVNNIKMVVSNFEVNLVGNYDPVKFPLKCKLVKTLVHTYEKVTGDDGTPVTTTGGTYAKLMPNIVPFGPSFPGQKGIGHQPNEWMTIEDIITNAKIYALSLYNLAK